MNDVQSSAMPVLLIYEKYFKVFHSGSQLGFGLMNGFYFTLEMFISLQINIIISDLNLLKKYLHVNQNKMWEKIIVIFLLDMLIFFLNFAYFSR